jgi:hypothetical protein
MSGERKAIRIMGLLIVSVILEEEETKNKE